MSIGVSVSTRNVPPSSGAPTATDVLFVVGKTGGTTGAVTECRSMADFTTVHNARESANQELYDYLDTFFREGGRRAYVSGYGGGGTHTAALALFTADYGPGQVAVADSTVTVNATLYGVLLDHAAANNRFALLDVASGDNTAAEITAKGDVIPSQNADYGAAFAPWANIPAPANVIGGTARQVPASAVAAGLIARADGLGNPNRAAAGRDFSCQFATSFAGALTKEEANTTVDAGVNAFLTRYGVLQLYGFQTSIAQSEVTPFWQINPARTRMWLVAHAQAIGEEFMFAAIDGRGRLAAALKSRLDSLCGDLYNRDGLYGATPAEAFRVETGEVVNTEDTVAAGELHGVVEARLSLHARTILLELVSVPVTGSVS